jgi:hypothetical protein
MSTDVFNLERKTALENHIDPTGKKWEIKGNRGTALVHARPNPDRSDAQIPKAFTGQWTSPAALMEKINTWLGQQWDRSEAATARHDRAVQAEVEAPTKVTPEESLAALPEEIKAELGAVLDVAPDYLTMKFAELKAIATPLGVKGTSKAVLIAGIEAHAG